MITECRCPKCGKIIEDYWDYDDPDEEYGDDEHWMTYRIKCDCGCYFAYTEIYRLSETYIDEL